jgi:hypothetical protein
MAILNNSNAISSGGYDINNSLRLRASVSGNLTRTPASTTNQKTFTWSGWFKRGTIGTEAKLFTAGTGSSHVWYLNLSDNVTDELTFGFFNGTNLYRLTTTQVFRDPSAWYHFVLAVDTTQATAANRVKLYVNGSEITSFGTATYPAQNTNTLYNTASTVQYIGNSPGGSNGIDGYLTEINFVDGSQLTPSSFGETDATTGSWKPKAYTGTYGTNGFYLKFSDIATTSGSNAGLGKDFSGNANYWTTNNISVTSGTTYDAMKDSPTNTSATVANYCVLNPLMNYGTAPASITNANLTATSNASGSNGTSILGTIAVSSGKWYWEYVVSSSIVAGNTVGIVGIDYRPNFQSDAYFDYYANGYGYKSNGQKGNNNTNTSYGASFTNGDVIGVALDLDAGTIVFYKNNTSQGTAFSGISGTFYPAIYGYSSSVMQTNFGQRPFSYTPPTGFVALNTYNLPDSTIKKGNSYMDATLYTGTGASLSVTNTSAFKPDFVWVKGRSGATDHALYDSVRGTTKQLESNTTTAETTESTGLTAFGTNGFTVGALAQMNTSSATYVGWQWQAGQGTNTTNTSGTITSTISVNATAGFSVVTWTGNGTAGATTGHGLGVTPAFVIIKNRTATAGEQWLVWHKSISQAIHTSSVITLNGYTGCLLLNGTNASFTYGFDGQINGSTNGMLAYCWADVSGYSKAFSYTGNGSADGPMVYLGFRPKWILIKNASNGVQGWTIQDTSRSTYNVVDNFLLAQANSAEQSIYAQMDYLSNGFKVRTSDALVNGSGNTIIGMAFAENPFKNANAR